METEKAEKVKIERVLIWYRESLWQSICSDAVTFGMLVFCIWFSGDSKFWNFVCFLMFFVYLLKHSRNVKEFKTKEELQAWFEEDEKGGKQ